MDDLLKGIGAMVAVVASLGAVALAVEQFTLRARLRKIEAWAVTMLDQDTSDARAAALTDIRLDATSRIVAGILTPVRFFAGGLAWSLVASAFIAFVIRSEEVTVVNASPAVLVAFLTVAFSTRRAIRAYLERCRIASEYRRGRVVEKPQWPILARMGRGLLIEFVFACAFSAGLCGVAVGSGLTMRRGDADGLPITLLYLGGAVVYGAIDILRIHARREHPMQDRPVFDPSDDPSPTVKRPL